MPFLFFWRQIANATTKRLCCTQTYQKQEEEMDDLMICLFHILNMSIHLSLLFYRIKWQETWNVDKKWNDSSQTNTQTSKQTNKQTKKKQNYKQTKERKNEETNQQNKQTNEKRFFSGKSRSNAKSTFGHMTFFSVTIFFWFDILCDEKLLR